MGLKINRIKNTKNRKNNNKIYPILIPLCLNKHSLDQYLLG